MTGPWQEPSISIADIRNSVLGEHDTEALSEWSSTTRDHIIAHELAALTHYQKSAEGQLALHLTSKENQRVFTLDSPKEGIEKLVAAQLRLVFDYRTLRPERANEIVNELSLPAAYWSAILGRPLEQMPRTIELINVALHFSARAVMFFKHKIALPRPMQLSAQIQPIIQNPGHGSLPSGHSTQSFMLARLLDQLHQKNHPAQIKDEVTTALLYRRAERIACNRTVAGVHFPIDSMAGRVLGEVLADLLLSLATQSQFKQRSFDLTAFEPSHYQDDLDASVPLDDSDLPYYKSGGSIETTDAAPVIRWLWQEVSAEWKTKA